MNGAVFTDYWDKWRNSDNNLADIVLRINTAMNHVSTKPGGGGVPHKHRRSRRRRSHEAVAVLTTDHRVADVSSPHSSSPP